MEKTPRRVGYARVSTDEQTLDLQTDALMAAGCAALFSDHGVSGASTRRDGLSQALAALEPGDTLVVWKLDRLGRSLRFLIDLIEDFRVKGCGFVSLTDGIDTTTSAGKLVFHIVAAIAEFERTLISERTRAGMCAARSRGQHIGRPRLLTEADVIEAHRFVADRAATMGEMADDLDVSMDTLRRGFRRFDLAA